VDVRDYFNPELLAGKVALVTGGASGIGFQMARGLGLVGAKVVIASRTVEKLERSVEELRAEGVDASWRRLNVREPEQVEEVVGQVADEHGGIDVLVNNAGVIEPHPITETSYAEWQRAWSHTLGVNLLGAANVTWCAVQHMGRGGRIVNVASRGAFRGEPRQPAYGASKAGLVAFGQSLARALGPAGISVTAVAPGFTDTDMAAEALAGEQGQRRRAESPLGRIATPQDIAAAVLFLASPQAELASGTVLDVNGASHLRM
jgi:3-oxoacyl-[acyl-carrier protein] reductase